MNPAAGEQQQCAASAPPLGSARPGAALVGAARACLLAAILAAFYAGSLGLDFYADDYVFLDRAQLDSARDWPSWFSFERNREGLLDRHHAYRPLSTNAWFGSLRALFGADPLAFHAANLALLWLNAMLVARVLAAQGCAPGLGFGLALGYATSAIAADGQLWLSVVQDLLATSAALASWLAFERARRERRGRWLALALAWLLVALLSKESALALPLLLLLREPGPRPAGAPLPPLAQRLCGPACAALVAGAFALWRIAAFGLPERGPYAQSLDFVLPNLGRHLLWAGEATLLLRSASALAAAAVAVALLAWCGGDRSRRLFGHGAAWFLAALLPVLFLSGHAYPFYLTLPLVGLAIAAAASLEAAAALLPQRARAPLAVAALAGFVALSHARFERRLAPLATRSALTRSILAQLREQLPQLPHGALLYFERPATLPRDTLFKHRGAVLRVLYDDDSLRGYELPPREGEAPWRLNRGPGSVLRLRADGKLEIIEARRVRDPAPPPAAAP